MVDRFAYLGNCTQEEREREGTQDEYLELEAAKEAEKAERAQASQLGSNFFEKRLAARWEAINAISGDNISNSYEKAGLTFERDGRFSRVMKNGIDVAYMTPQFNRRELHDAIIGNIQGDAKVIGEILTESYKKLNLPAGYTFRFNPESSIRDINSFHGKNMCAFIQLGGKGSEYNPNQADVELRVFLDSPRAIVFAKKGPRFFGQNEDLLKDGEPHLSAQSYEELAPALVSIFNDKILQRADLEVASATPPAPYEPRISHLPDEDFERLVDEAIDAACLVIQKAVGQTDGGLAGAFFSDDKQKDSLRQYLRSELNVAQYDLDDSLEAALQIASNKPSCSMAIHDGNNTYDGRILGLTDHHVIQNGGRSAVIHEKSRLDSIPLLNEHLSISYKGQGRGSIDRNGQSPDKDLAR